MDLRVGPPHYSNTKIIQYLATVLYWIGKPFFVLLSTFFALFISFLWIIGETTLKAPDKISKLVAGAIKSFFAFPVPVKKPRLSPPKLRLPKIRLNLPAPRFQLSLPRFSHPKFRRPTLRVSWKLRFAILLLGLAVVGSFQVWNLILKDLPHPGELVTREQAVSTKIYDRNGNLLFKIYRNQNRSLIKLADLPSSLRQATVAIEDADFYSHPGFSVRGIVRSIWRNSTNGELTGGSTITQQLVKNTLLSPEKTIIRKIKEVILAIQVELTFTKDEILEMYFNEVGYGGAAYGIEEASLVYFGKHASELDLAQSALLAGLPKAPTTYSPFGANPELARARQLEVLSRMVQDEHITQTEADSAAIQELVYAAQKTDIQAPHFVMYVRQLLAEKYGERMVEEGGLEVITSLDMGLQEKVQQIVTGEVDKIRGLRISNGASLVTNPKTGEILAMVGSTDYHANKFGNYNVTTALRQPGSSIKPVNYSYALESGKYTAASLISDTSITYQVAGSPPYTPRNYDNTFRGNVPLRIALGSSLNIPAVKVLASYGVDKMIEQAQKMGITTWNNPRNYGLSLTLGGGEVKMTDMTVAYGTFSNYGKRVDLQPILSVTNYKGEVLEQSYCDVTEQVNQNLINQLTNYLIPSILASEAKAEEICGNQVLDSRAAFIITDILRDNDARKAVFGPNSLLVIPEHKEVAVKTGTTQNLRDNWAIGYTQEYVVAAWVGNNDNTPMAYVASGVTGATPIWHKIMRTLLDGKPNHSWEEPQGLAKAEICPATGTLPCEGCSKKLEYFIPGTEPKRACVPKPPEETGPNASPVPQIL